MLKTWFLIFFTPQIKAQPKMVLKVMEIHENIFNLAPRFLRLVKKWGHSEAVNVGGSAIFWPRKSILCPKVPQNGLKLKKSINKYCEARDKVHLYQFSDYLANNCGHNL